MRFEGTTVHQPAFGSGGSPAAMSSNERAMLILYEKKNKQRLNKYKHKTRTGQKKSKKKKRAKFGQVHFLDKCTFLLVSKSDKKGQERTKMSKNSRFRDTLLVKIGQNGPYF
jgi:hypothetical protein